jgi:phage tail-like protein
MPAGKTGARTDPELNGFFRVEIEGIDAASFTKCSGLKTETEIYELQEGGRNDAVVKRVGQTRAGNIVLTRGFVNDPALLDWYDKLVNAENEKVPRKTGSVVQCDQTGEEVTRWKFFNAIPVRWEMGEYDSMSNAAQCEILELAVESISKGR